MIGRGVDVRTASAVRVFDEVEDLSLASTRKPKHRGLRSQGWHACSIGMAPAYKKPQLFRA
jgi:hypothetical protein